MATTKSEKVGDLLMVNPIWQQQFDIIAELLDVEGEEEDLKEELIDELQNNSTEDMEAAIKFFLKRFKSKPATFFHYDSTYKLSDNRYYLHYLLDLIVEDRINSRHLDLFDFNCPVGRWEGELIYKFFGNKSNLKLYFYDLTNDDYYWFSVFLNDNYSPRDRQINFKNEELGTKYLLETQKSKSRGLPVFVSAKYYTSDAN